MLNNRLEKVEFVSYTGKYPNLCLGVLTLKIGNSIYKFGQEYIDGEDKNLPSFWKSGGCVQFDTEWNAVVDEEAWELSSGADELPDKLKPYRYRMIEVFNDNVEFGCCGGCI